MVNVDGQTYFANLRVLNSNLRVAKLYLTTVDLCRLFNLETENDNLPPYFVIINPLRVYPVAF